MLTKKDLLLISKDYFVILNQTAYYIEFMSKRTGHCWIIYKHGSAEKYPVWLYHKHSQKISVIIYRERRILWILR